MAYQPNPIGQQVMASSVGVVIASNQSPVSVAGTLNITGNPSISGTVNAISTNVGSVITVAQGSIATVIIGGSIAASFTPPANQSVSGTVGASVLGTVPVTQSGAWTTSVVGTVFVAGSVAAILTGTVNQSVSGTVGASIVGQLPAGTAVLGSVAVLQGTTPWLISSVYGNISGSVVAFQGAGWSGSVAAVITNTNVNVSGSVVATQGTNPWVMGSIVGTYGEDVPSTAADKGLFTLGIRNDTVASLVGTDLDYTGWSTDSAGRHLMKPFSADEARLDTVSSTVSTSVTALFNSVVGLRLYVTDVMIANTGSVATLVTFRDGSTSILGYTIAPAGGGSNINGMAFPMRTAPGQDFTYVNATASSVLYVTAKGYKAP